MFVPWISSALLLLAAAELPPAPGEARVIAGKALDERQQVDGIWKAGTCRITTALPVGYPPPTAPGAIELKSYPIVRKAEATAPLGPEVGRNLAFWKLFQHIQRREIAMTSPVEMKLEVAGEGEGEKTLAGWTMAFLYREPTMGKLGEDGEVAVSDDAPITVISIGVKGDYSTERALAEAETLRSEVAKLEGWRVVGSPRALFYNGPDTRPEDRWAEVQLTLERIPEPAAEPPKKERPRRAI